LEKSERQGRLAALNRSRQAKGRGVGEKSLKKFGDRFGKEAEGGYVCSPSGKKG
jgi:hypothetical protein